MALPSQPAVIRYWIEFVPPDPYVDDDEDSLPLARAYGVTAASLDDALALIRQLIFRQQPLPPVQRVIEDIDPALLAMWHMGPMSMVPNQRGIWYPPVGGVHG